MTTSARIPNDGTCSRKQGRAWSIARNVSAYKSHLTDCDLPRRNDLDGRGNLSEESLVAFARFFLQTCLDQVAFMEQLVQPDRLRNRVLLWAEEESRAAALPPKAGRILEAILYRGEFARGEGPQLLGSSERQTRRVVAALIELGVVTSTSSRHHCASRFRHGWRPVGCRDCFPTLTFSEATRAAGR